MSNVCIYLLNEITFFYFIAFLMAIYMEKSDIEARYLLSLSTGLTSI